MERPDFIAVVGVRNMLPKEAANTAPKPMVIGPHTVSNLSLGVPAATAASPPPIPTVHLITQTLHFVAIN
jgi:hypothetical protein